MRARGAILRLEGDWNELCEKFGLLTWQSSTRPSICCAGSRERLYNPIGVTLASLPWHRQEDAEYDAACNRCELWVRVVNHDQRSMIEALLDYKSDRWRGRGVNAPFPELGLRRGDRLEPNPLLPSVARFGDLALPTDVPFGRTTNDTLCTRG